MSDEESGLPPHARAMLEAGWVAVRNIEGEIERWQNPHYGSIWWDDAEAKIYFDVGDCESVPYLRRPPKGEGT